MESANLPQRVLSFLLDLAILGALMFIVGTVVLTPLGIMAGVILGGRWDFQGYTFGMISVILVGLTVVSYVYFIRGFTRGATPGQRLFRLSVVREDGSAPNLRQATVRYLAGFLIPLSLPILIHLLAEKSWMSRHAAAEPKLEIPERRLTVPTEVRLARREWEAAGQQMRARLDVFPWLLYGGELGLMGLMIFCDPRRRGWHDRLAGTLVIHSVKQTMQE